MIKNFKPQTNQQNSRLDIDWVKTALYAQTYVLDFD